jgi:MoaA/NifB/PqqE/SkfB family radical SAM enzyme
MALSQRLTSRLAQVPGADAAKRNRSLRRLAYRMGVEPHNPRPVAPERPVGVKLELTYSCNLRCGFCYTDSPRRTLERPAELSDDAWRAVADDAIALGVIEAVVTGGEPFLRHELTLDLLERLTTGGVATCLNTNGWFVDEAVADRLAALHHLRVHVSLDGPTPEVHDRARGVPGSWRRAVQALALLLERGVRVQVVHVPTPDNAGTLPDLIEQMWLLGVPSLRISPVVSIGAAGRGGRGAWPGGSWNASSRRLARDSAPSSISGSTAIRCRATRSSPPRTSWCVPTEAPWRGL